MSSSEPRDDLDAVRVLDHLVARAVKTRASDVHVEPRREGLQVRFRIDGVMTPQGTLPADLAPILVSRVKVLARMDMTERRLPQDGQFSQVDDRGAVVHLRASTFPSLHGETLVLRVLQGHQLFPTTKIGLDDDQRRRLEALCHRTNGLVVVCGPTGSGKTSTLYAMLQIVDTARRSVITLEDPVEVDLPEVTQGQTNTRTDFTFAAGLRAILRQDPDVILVGEMRDGETAQIASQASLTGHLVLSTLHTSDVVETVVRLIDLGVEPWIVANSLLAIVAQRLVRVLCACAASVELPDDVRDDAGALLLARGAKVRQAAGCPRCHETGYRGRTGLFETAMIDDDVRELIKARAPKKAFVEAFHAKGHVPLRRAGIRRVEAGVTSLEEVLRVT